MKANWDGISDDVSGFDPIPDGDYVMKVTKIDERSTNGGDPMWAMTLEVQGGSHSGRRVFDNLVWSAAGMKRVKFILKRLGLELSGEQEVSVEDVVGRMATVTVYTETYHSEKHGREKTRNGVPFDGYKRFNGTVPAVESSDVPF